MCRAGLAVVIALAVASGCRAEAAPNARPSAGGTGDAARDAPSAAESHFVLTGGTVVGSGRHVHLAYLPKASELAAGGITAAVDLAAPISTLGALPQSIEVISSEPMLTAPLGYPTQSWGRDGGAKVFYGTDFGDVQTAAINEVEIAELAAAGLEPAAIIDSATRAPAAFWGFTDLGAVEPGKAASLLVLDRDPLADPSSLARPIQVYLRGRKP